MDDAGASVRSRIRAPEGPQGMRVGVSQRRSSLEGRAPGSARVPRRRGQWVTTGQEVGESATSRVGLRLFAANGRQRRLFFESPVETIAGSREVAYELPRHRIEAELRAGDVDTRARVCVVVRSDACRL